MVPILIAIVAVVVIVLAFLGALIVSARRKGRLAMTILTRLMGTRLGKWLLRRSGVGGDVDAASIQEVLQSNPELIEQLAAQQGMDGSQVQAALKQFTSLSPEQQRRTINQAQKTTGVDASGLLTPGPSAQPPRSAAQAKRKEAERRKRKQAKKQKRR